MTANSKILLSSIVDNTEFIECVVDLFCTEYGWYDEDHLVDVLCKNEELTVSISNLIEDLRSGLVSI